MEVIRRWREVQGAEMGTEREGSGLRAQGSGPGGWLLPAAPLPGAWGCCAGLKARLCSQAHVLQDQRLEAGQPPREERTPGQKRSIGHRVGGGLVIHSITLAVQRKDDSRCLSRLATPHPQKILGPPLVVM